MYGIFLSMYFSRLNYSFFNTRTENSKHARTNCGDAHRTCVLFFPSTPIPGLSNQPLPITTTLLFHGLELLDSLQVRLAGAALACSTHGRGSRCVACDDWWGARSGLGRFEGERLDRLCVARVRVRVYA